MNAPTRRLSICFVVLTISVAVVVFGSAAPSQKLSSVAPPSTQEKLAGKEFTHPPEKPHDPAALIFKFDQLRKETSRKHKRKDVTDPVTVTSFSSIAPEHSR